MAGPRTGPVTAVARPLRCGAGGSLGWPDVSQREAVSGPIAFTPLFMERVWGGRRLAERYGKRLPAGAIVGESWELVDRAEAQSTVRGGQLARRSLHELWAGELREELFGARAAGAGDRFPLLIKLLDASDGLSVQVHPPEHLSAELGGEPKSEMWYLAHAAPGAHLYAGLRQGVTRDTFEATLRAGEDLSAFLHRIEVSAGDAIFIPSGRIHAIGAGCLIVEVQQSSDTTYRAFDFNRPGLDGRPRELHVEQALRSIDWADIEPRLEDLDAEDGIVVDNSYFTVERWVLDRPRRGSDPGECAVVFVLSGAVVLADARFGPGELFLVPATAGGPLAPLGGRAELLRVTLPGP